MPEGGLVDRAIDLIAADNLQAVAIGNFCAPPPCPFMAVLRTVVEPTGICSIPTLVRVGTLLLSVQMVASNLVPTGRKLPGAEESRSSWQVGLHARSSRRRSRPSSRTAKVTGNKEASVLIGITEIPLTALFLSSKHYFHGKFYRFSRFPTPNP